MLVVDLVLFNSSSSGPPATEADGPGPRSRWPPRSRPRRATAGSSSTTPTSSRRPALRPRPDRSQPLRGAAQRPGLHRADRRRLLQRHRGPLPRGPRSGLPRRHHLGRPQRHHPAVPARLFPHPAAPTPAGPTVPRPDAVRFPRDITATPVGHPGAAAAHAGSGPARPWYFGGVLDRSLVDRAGGRGRAPADVRAGLVTPTGGIHWLPATEVTSRAGGRATTLAARCPDRVRGRRSRGAVARAPAVPRRDPDRRHRRSRRGGPQRPHAVRGEPSRTGSSPALIGSFGVFHNTARPRLGLALRPRRGPGPAPGSSVTAPAPDPTGDQLVTVHATSAALVSSAASRGPRGVAGHGRRPWRPGHRAAAAGPDGRRAGRGDPPGRRAPGPGRLPGDLLLPSRNRPWWGWRSRPWPGWPCWPGPSSRWLASGAGAGRPGSGREGTVRGPRRSAPAGQSPMAAAARR